MDISLYPDPGFYCKRCQTVLLQLPSNPQNRLSTILGVQSIQKPWSVSSNSVGQCLVNGLKLSIPLVDGIVLPHPLGPARSQTNQYLNLSTKYSITKVTGKMSRGLHLSPRSSSLLTWSMWPWIRLSRMSDTNSCSTSFSGKLSS